MRPSPIRYIFPHSLTLLYFGAALFGAISVAQEFSPGGTGILTGPFLLDAPKWPGMWITLAIYSSSALLGLMAMFASPVIFSIISKANGAPFRQGDMVRILIGPHKDRVARVYDVWQSRHQVRVWFDDKEAKREAFDDVFFETEVFRESHPEELQKS